LDFEKIAKYLNQATEIPSIKVVVFTGGECFLLQEDLTRAVEYANDLGYITRCVSNAYWAIDNNTSHQKLKPLLRAGLKEINFSTGDHHLKYVPLENVIRATKLACQAGLTTVVNIELYKNAKTKSKLRTIFSNLKKDYNNLIVNYGLWIPNGGQSKIYHDKQHRLNSKTIDKIGCDSILSSISITPKNEVISCCGMYINYIPELVMGYLSEKTLPEILSDQHEDVLKLWIYLEGPYKVLQAAALHNNTIRLSKNYVHPCQACLKLYKTKKYRASIYKACLQNTYRLYEQKLTLETFSKTIQNTDAKIL